MLIMKKTNEKGGFNMTKKDFFSKLKNYNNELEQVLEKKTFSSTSF